MFSKSTGFYSGGKFFVILFFLFVALLAGSACRADINKGPFLLCTNVNCGSNSYCYEGSCHCSAGFKNCDGDFKNGCECGGLNVDCASGMCGCSKGFTDCDGNMGNGCEVGGACPPCKPKQTRTCDTSNICNGKQTCDADGYWGSCVRTSNPICSPGASANCSSSINGQKCSTLSGSKQCNSCGNSYGACVLPSDIQCCPKSTTDCVVGSCTGKRTCSDDGRIPGLCVSGDITCCAQDTDCNDFNGCTTEKCVNNRCEFLAIEDCQSLTPIKCQSDANCASKDSCVNGSCTPIKCNDKFVIENHKCACDGSECGGGCYFSSGICCGGHWNDDFDTCSFDLSYYQESVDLSQDKEAGNLLLQAKQLVDSGDLRKASIVAKIAITKAEIVLSSQPQQIKNSALATLGEAKDLLSGGNYSLAADKADEAMNALENKNVATETETQSFWQKNKTPVIIFSSVIAVLLVAIIYIIFTPKI